MAADPAARSVAAALGFCIFAQVWAYAADLHLGHGPLHYSQGAHRWLPQPGPLNQPTQEHTSSSSSFNLTKKLVWLHESTLLPAPRAMLEPALRMHPDAAAAPSHGFRPLRPILPLREVIARGGRTLIVADTAGLHHRGVAKVGQVCQPPPPPLRWKHGRRALVHSHPLHRHTRAAEPPDAMY
jgi:hypothetical protein